jgi:ribosomal protein S18 acetylase RimI-like enzyme
MIPHATQLVRAHTLTTAQLAETEALRRVCNQAEGITLKLNLPSPWCSLPECSFLCYAGDTLVGYCGLEGGPSSIEVCGMVAPAWRQRGIGKLLLSAALEAARASGVQAALLICEDASRSGQRVVAAAHYALDFREHHMEARAQRYKPARALKLKLRAAEPADINAIAAITAAAFGDPVDRVRASLSMEMSDTQSAYFVGMGYGRETLLQIMNLAERRGQETCYLEVESENAAALALYTSVGFRTTTTYGYYRIPL